MCGRVRLSSDVSEIKLVFSIPPHRPTPNTAPSWNVAPTDPLPVVRYDAKAGERSLDVMRWAWYRSGPRTSKLPFRISTPKPRGLKVSRRSAKHFSGGAVSCLWITFTSRRRPRPGNSRMRLRWPTAG
jgi:hypothetical protein